MTGELILDLGTSDIPKAISRFEEFDAILGADLNVAMESSLQFLESQVFARTPVNFGHLRDSIQHEILEPYPNLVGEVGSPRDPYARVIEYGRTPGSRPPPVDAIKLWATRKLQIPEDEIDAVARLIALHIGHHGFTTIPKGARMFETGTEISEPFINQIFAQAVRRSISRFGAVGA